jgi:hypothetical protein
MLARAGRMDSMAVVAEGAAGLDALRRPSGTGTATFSTDALGLVAVAWTESGVLRSATQPTALSTHFGRVSKSRRNACRSSRPGCSEYALAAPQLLVSLHVLHCLVWLMIDP